MKDVVELIISFMFAISFLNKTQNLEDLKYNIASYQLFGYRFLTFWAISIILLEGVISCSFLFRVLYPWKEIVTATLLMVFIFLQYRLKSRYKSSCNCFGEKSLLNKYPITRNILLLLMLIGVNTPIYLNHILSLQTNIVTFLVLLMLYYFFQFLDVNKDYRGFSKK